MLSPRWRKVIRDLWSNKTRTILIVLSIAVGIFAFGSVYITQDVIIQDMATQYQNSHPASIMMYTQPLDDSLIRWAKRQEEVSDASGRAVYSVIMVNGGKKQNLDIYASDKFADTTLNRIVPEQGNWPPERGQIFLERTSNVIAGLAIGDKITIDMSDGRSHELTFAGTVHDLEVFPANMFPQMSAYVHLKTAAELGLPDDYNRLDVLVQPGFDSKAKVEAAGAVLKDRLHNIGFIVGSMQAREPGEHWAKPNTESFSLILSIIGFFSLVLSGFLVVNTVTALLADQRRQIGIMKGVGGTARQIMGIYLALVTVYGLLALFIALPVGMALGYVFTSAVAGLLNLNILDFHLPARVFLMQVIAALAVPTIASLVPILGGVRITTREAMSNYGIKSKGDHGVIARMLLALRFLPRPLLLSLRNTFRRKARLMLSLGSLAIAGTLFITVINVQSSLNKELDNSLSAVFNFEIQMNLDNTYERIGLERKAEAIPGVIQAEGRTGAAAQYVKPDGAKGNTFPIVGLPPENDFVQVPIQSGRWLQTGDRNRIVITSKLASEMSAQPGDEITLTSADKNRKWTVIGISDMGMDRTGYVDFNYLSAVQGMPGLASSLYIRTDPDTGLSQEQMVKEIGAGLKTSGVGVTQTMTRDVIVAANATSFNFLIAFLLSMAAMTALIGALGLAGMMSLNVMERTREIGIMRSIGASHSAIGSIVASEGMLIGIISWMMAVPLSIPFSMIFDTMLGTLFAGKPLGFVFAPVGIVIWLGLVLLIALASSLLPAIRATRMSIRETLAYE